MPDTSLPEAGRGVLSYPFAEPPEFGTAREVAPGVLWIRLPLPMALDHVNVYALREADGWTLVDTGFDTAKTRKMWEALLADALGGAPVRRVVATHHHPDHIGLAGWFMQREGAELWTTRTAYLMARMMVLDDHPTPIPETLAFWRSAGMDERLYAQRAKERPFNFSDCVTPLPLGYRRLQQDDRVEMGGREWVVHIGHGHAPEHATFWEVGGDLVLGGDQLLPSISPNLGVYATEPGADPVGEWLESCGRLGAHARPDQLVLPGHKLPFRGLPVRLSQLIANHHGALERLLAHLARPQTAAGCFDVLFKRRIGDGEYGLALVEAMAHMNHLHHLGAVTRTQDDKGRFLWQRR